MQGRLGIYDKYYSHDTVLDSKLVGIKNQQTRMNHHGGNLQQDRMIADKRRSLKRALFYSYQGANVKKQLGKRFPFVHYENNILDK